MLGLGAGGLVSACVPLGAFQCESDAMCVRNGLPGTCQPNDYCSYDDDICESGQRYGEYAGGGLAGACVDDDPGTALETSSETSFGTTDFATSDDGPAESSGSTGSAVGSTGPADDSDTGTGEPECGRSPEPCWEMLYDEPAGAYQRGFGIALAPDDGWAVAGSMASDLEGVDEDAWVLRWDADRDLRWGVPLVETPDSMDVARNVAFADDGTLSAIGSRADATMAFVATLDSDGEESGYFEFGTGASSRGWDLAYDGPDLRVVGTVGDGLGGTDAWIARYALDGNELWSDGLTGAFDDDARGLVIGPAGLFYVVGSTYEDADSRRWFMRRYVDEEQQWEERLGINWSVGRSVALGASENPTFVGTSEGGLYVSYRAPSGVELWAEPYSTSDDGTHGAEDVAVDGAGNVVVVGWLSVAGQGGDGFVRKYDPQGETLWTAWHDEEGGADRANGVVVDSQDRAIVVGYVEKAAGDVDLWLAMYPP